MTKIYTTPEDVERERLTHKAQGESDNQTALLMYGSTTSLAGMLGFVVDRLSAKLPPVFESKFWNGFYKGFYKALGWVGSIVGIAVMGLALFEGWAGRKTRKELEKLGPEQIVMPEDLQKNPPQQNAVEGKYISRLQKDRDSAAINAVIPPR